MPSRSSRVSSSLHSSIRLCFSRSFSCSEWDGSDGNNGSDGRTCQRWQSMAAMAEHPPVSNATQRTHRLVAHSRCASHTGCVHTPCPHPSA